MASLNFPSNPADGDFYEGFQYDGDFGVWKRVGGSGAASMTVSETPPTQGLTSGAMWLDSTTGNTYIYYEDGNTSQWIQSSGPEVVPGRNSEFFIQTTAPGSPVDGDVWYDPTEGFTYIYYEDVDSSQWIQFGLNRNGAPGIDGTDGDDGVGIPAGGVAGQTLVKSSNTDYAVEWGAAAGGGAGDFLEATSDTIALDFSDTNSFIKRAVAGDVTITASGYTAGASKKIYLAGDTTKRSLSFPVEWKFTNTLAPTHVGSDDTNILQLDCFGNTASDTVAQWIGPYAFEPIEATGGSIVDMLVGSTTYRIHTFSTTDTFIVSDPGSAGEIEYLIVAGGGAGGAATRGGGGGAGGLLTSVPGESSGGGSGASAKFSVAATNYQVVVGSGGAVSAYDANNGAAGGQSGSNSSFGGIVAIGGGGGGASDSSGTDRSPKAGGSGGGGWYQHGAGGAGTSGQGYPGGAPSTSAPYGGGGGGAGEAGGSALGPGNGYGGDGVVSSISGNSLYYAGGGSSSNFQTSSSWAPGLGGGGTGDNAATTANSNTNGQTNTGGGGGAMGNGGSGVVIIRYPITDPNE